jgi:hypothetical protein
MASATTRTHTHTHAHTCISGPRAGMCRASSACVRMKLTQSIDSIDNNPTRGNWRRRRAHIHTSATSRYLVTRAARHYDTGERQISRSKTYAPHESHARRTARAFSVRPSVRLSVCQCPSRTGLPNAATQQLFVGGTYLVKPLKRPYVVTSGKRFVAAPKRLP